MILTFGFFIFMVGFCKNKAGKLSPPRWWCHWCISYSSEQHWDFLCLWISEKIWYFFGAIVMKIVMKKQRIRLISFLNSYTCYFLNTMVWTGENIKIMKKYFLRAVCSSNTSFTVKQDLQLRFPLLKTKTEESIRPLFLINSLVLLSYFTPPNCYHACDARVHMLRYSYKVGL